MSVDTLQHKAGASPRILVVRVGAMGDVIHALPAVASLREALPGASIGWAIEPRWEPLLRASGATKRDPAQMPLVDAVHLVAAKQWNRRPFSPATAQSVAALRRELRDARYDVAIDLQGTLRSAVIARLSGAAVVVGSAAPRESAARWLYRTRIGLTATHVTDQADALLRAGLVAMLPSGLERTAGKTAEPASPGGQEGLSLLPRDDAAEAWWRNQRTALCLDRPTVLLAGTAGWGAKEWPPEKFAALAAALAARGHCVLLNTNAGVTDSNTTQVLQRIAVLYPEQAHRVHTLAATLPQLIAASRDMRAVIAGDTGPLHLAAALGVPTVGLFGPTDPARTGPQRARSQNLRHISSVTDHRRHAQTEAGLERLTVDDALGAFEQVTDGGLETR